jgi:hypothetical protein
MARMIAAHTTHGLCSAPKRAEKRYIRTLIVRSRLTCTATPLLAHLPPEMAARLDLGPPELSVRVHPSNLPFAASAGTTPCNVRNGPGGTRRAPGSGRAGGAARPALRGRAAERLAALAEADSQAPWRQAIAFARAAKRAAPAWAAKRTKRARAAGGTAPAARHDAMLSLPSGAPAPRPGGENAARAARLGDGGEGPDSGAAEARRPGPESALGWDSPLQRELAARAAGLRARGNGQDQGGAVPGPGPESALGGNNAMKREGEGAVRRAAPSPGSLRDPTSPAKR